MKLSRLAVLFLVPLALAACAGGTSVIPPAGSQPTAPDASQPSAPDASQPTAPDASQPTAPDASQPASPPRAEVVGSSNSLSTGRWTLRLTSPSGAVATAGVRADAQMRPHVLGVVDADQDGDREVFVSVGSGASTTTYAVFTVVEDGVAEVRTRRGDGVRLIVGGSVPHGDGFRCGAGTLTVLSVVTDDGESYRGTATAYAWRDDLLTETGRTTFTGTAEDAKVRAAYGVDCGSL